MFSLPIASVAAHPFSLHAGSWWIIEPPIALGVPLLTVLYLYAIGPLRKRRRLADQVDRRQVASFLLAMVILFASLQGPLHELSDYYSLSAHMVQHLLVTLIMPPLLLKGIPHWLIDPVVRMRGVGSVIRFLTHPFVAFLPFNAVFAVSHAPQFYQAALGVPAVHSVEHTLYMSTAVLTWWPIFSPSRLLPPLSDPLQMLYLFAQSLIPTILGAIITFANQILYPFYEAAPRVIGLSARDDQQAAGLIMWLGGTSIVLLILTIRFFRWLDFESDEKLEASRV